MIGEENAGDGGFGPGEGNSARHPPLTSSEGRTAFKGAEALEAALEDATRRAKEVASLYDSLLQSPSWRMTAPMRKLAASIPAGWAQSLQARGKSELVDCDALAHHATCALLAGTRAGGS